MLKKPNYGKLLAVVFLTVLIWVWADLALDEQHTIYNATIRIATSDRKLWARFENASSFSIQQVVLRGPAARIAEAKRKVKEEPLDFDFDIAQEKMAEPGDHTLVLLPLLQKSSRIKELGVKVESCEPERVSVTVIGLVEKTLPVNCVDENGNVLAAGIEAVAIFVPQEWEEPAKVLLRRAEIDQARVRVVAKVPFVELAAAQRINAEKTVGVKLLPEQDPRQDCQVTAWLHIAMSPVLLGEYTVDITNREDVMRPIQIRATPEAMRAYENQPYAPMTLYILDDDIKKGDEEQRREVVYNFPPDYFRNGEIDLQNPQQPARAKFKLIKLGSASPTDTSLVIE